jgi:hypothetical protein
MARTTKTRRIEDIRAELEERIARLADLHARGNRACSKYDLSMGYTALWY